MKNRTTVFDCVSLVGALYLISFLLLNQHKLQAVILGVLWAYVLLSRYAANDDADELDKAKANLYTLEMNYHIQNKKLREAEALLPEEQEMLYIKKTSRMWPKPYQFQEFDAAKYEWSLEEDK